MAQNFGKQLNASFDENRRRVTILVAITLPTSGKPSEPPPLRILIHRHVIRGPG